jgi:SAM-dependent methyltransferase
LSANPLPWRELRSQADYQIFDLGTDGQITQIGPRMAQKLAAIRLPGLAGKRVLDVGTDFGFWSFLAANEGASQVLGLDRGRRVRGLGWLDLVLLNQATAHELPRLGACEFRAQEIGRQWREHGTFDVVLCMSMYHHAYNVCGDHGSVWLWLARHTAPGGLLVWEGPLDANDPVVQKDVAPSLQADYAEDVILEAAERYFEVVYRGPAVHESTRDVLHLRRRLATGSAWTGNVETGAGGASKAFSHAAGRRIAEVRDAVGVEVVPGSLNLRGKWPFWWHSHYYRARVSDVTDRRAGLAGQWFPRWCRLYPLSARGLQVYAMRFEGEQYPDTFVELLSGVHLRSMLSLNDRDPLTVVAPDGNRDLQ